MVAHASLSPLQPSPPRLPGEHRDGEPRGRREDEGPAGRLRDHQPSHEAESRQPETPKHRSRGVKRRGFPATPRF